MRIVRPNTRGEWTYLFTTEKTFIGSVALGNATQYQVFMIKDEMDRLYVAVMGRGAYEFSGHAHPSYVQQKLGLKFEGDASNLADFINTQNGSYSYEKYGQYDSNLCVKEK